MRCVQHPTNNDVIGAPRAWDQNALRCGAMPATFTVVEGLPVIMSFWKPTPDELQRLVNGAFVAVTIVGETTPPIGLEVSE